MITNQSFFVVDAHTTGTPIRVITSGIPTLKGKTVGEKMAHMAKEYDNIRKGLMCPPRGYESLVGAVLTAPCRDDADFGLFYIDDLTYQPMCGAGTLSVAKVLIETGMVKIEEPVTTIRLETPSGLVTARAQVQNGSVESVSIENVPAFLYKKDLKINVEGIGELTVDIGFGGNFFTLVDITQTGRELKKENIPELRELSRKILAASNAAVEIVHPLDPSINYMDQMLYCDNTQGEDGTYLCQCIYGDAQADISPCGTGTSTRMAVRYARGLLGIGDSFRQKSVYGGIFEGTPLREVQVGNITGVIPRITCKDVHITGYNHLVAEINDATF